MSLCSVQFTVEHLLQINGVREWLTESVNWIQGSLHISTILNVQEWMWIGSLDNNLNINQSVTSQTTETQHESESNGSSNNDDTQIIEKEEWFTFSEFEWFTIEFVVSTFVL